MQALSNTSHTVQLVVPPAVIQAPERPAAWVGRSRRLVMEYCSEGSLNDLEQRRGER